MIKQDLEYMHEFLESLCIAQGLTRNSNLSSPIFVSIVDPTAPDSIYDGNYTFSITDKNHTLVSVDFDEERAVTLLRFSIQGAAGNLRYTQHLGERCEKNKTGMLTSVRIHLPNFNINRIHEIIGENTEFLYLV